MSTPHAVSLVRQRLREAGLERLLVTPVADLAPRLFPFSRRGARLAERLGGDRPSLLLSSALAELTGQVSDSGKRALPTVLIDRLTYALHAYIDKEASKRPETTATFSDSAVPPPMPQQLRPLLIAVEALHDRLVRTGIDHSALPALWRKRSRVTIDEGGAGAASIGAGFFFTDDPSSVPSGVFLDVSGLDDERKPLAFVGVRGPLPSPTALWYAADRIKDVIMEPLFDEAPRLMRLAGGRYGALLAALDDLVVVDADRPRLTWVYHPHKAMMLPTVRGTTSIADAAAVELCKSAARGKVSANKVNDAVRAIAFATDVDRAFALAQGQRGKATGEAVSLLIDHPFVEDEAGTALRVVGGHVRVDVGEDSRVRLTCQDRVVDPAALQDGHALVLDAAARRLIVVSADAAERQLARAVQQLGDVQVPDGVRTTIAARLKRSRVEAALPAALRGEERPPSSSLVCMVACVRAGNDPLGGGARLSIRARPIAGGPTLVPGTGPKLAFGDDDSGPCFCQRDLVSEQERAAAVVSDVVAVARGEIDAGPYAVFVPQRERALAALAHLVSRGDVELAVSGDVLKLERGQAEALRVRYEEKTDWIGIEGELVLGEGERAALQPIIDALREGRRYLMLDTDHLVAFDDELAARLGGLAAFSVQRGRALQVPKASSLVVAETLGVSLERASAARVADTLRALDDVDGVPSPLVQATLRPYQQQGLRFLRRLALTETGAVLADDMGLGKTLTAIAFFIDRAQRGPQLVVAPTSLLHHWAQEIARFAPSLRPRVLADAATAAERIDVMKGARDGDVVITSYGMATRDIDALASVTFATALFDEAQAVKNAATARAKALRELKVRVRIALTGTPVENHTGELWSLLDLVCPGVFGTAQQFRARFAEPIEKDHDDARRALLSRALRPFVLRRTKAQVAKELPEKIERTLLLSPSPEEQTSYEQLRKAVLVSLTERGIIGKDRKKLAKEKRPEPGQVRVQILSAITRLRLHACHPALTDPILDTAHAPPATKHKALVSLLSELHASGHAALVFSQFVSHLRLAQRYVHDVGMQTLMLTGETPTAERARLVERFQGGEAQAFFISLKAGGFGLNLTRATTVVHLDPWWNPAVEDQASDRAHRIGQTLPVTVVRLVMDNTIEAPILSLHTKKRALADAVLEGTDAASSLGVDDLYEILRGVRLTVDD